MKNLDSVDNIIQEINEMLVKKDDYRVDTISIKEVYKLMRKRVKESDDLEYKYENKIGKKLSATTDINFFVFIGTFDYREREMKISISPSWKMKYEDDLKLKKIDGDLRIVSGHSLYSSELISSCGDVLNDLYDHFIKYSYLDEFSYNISSSNSLFKIDISNYGVGICSADKFFGSTFKLNRSTDGKKYKCETESSRIAVAVNGYEKQLFKNIHIKISNCPKWMQDELYKTRVKELTEEFSKLTTNKDTINEEYRKNFSKIWKNSLFDSMFDSNNKISVRDIVKLYVEYCNNVKKAYESEVLNNPFYNRICEIINGMGMDKNKLNGLLRPNHISLIRKENDARYLNEIDFIDKRKIPADFIIKIDLQSLWDESIKSKKEVEFGTIYHLPDILFYFKKDDLYYINSVTSKYDVEALSTDQNNKEILLKYCKAVGGNPTYHSCSVISHTFVNNIVRELTKNKDELKYLCDKYVDNNLDSNNEKTKEKYLEILNEKSVLLDNGITLKFKIDNAYLSLDKDEILDSDIIIEVYDEKMNLVDTYQKKSDKYYKTVVDDITTWTGKVYKNINLIPNTRVKSNYSVNYNKMFNYKVDENYISDYIKSTLEKPVIINSKNTNVDIDSEVEKSKVEESKKLDEIENIHKEIDELIIEIAKREERLIELTGKTANVSKSIRVNEDYLFIDTDKGYKVIREEVRGNLKYLDLSLIDFSNVLVRGIDFRNCNPLFLNPQTVYNKDLSGCNFSTDMLNTKDYIFGISTDFNEVNLCGTDLSCEGAVMISFDGAITDDETVLPKVKVKK